MINAWRIILTNLSFLQRSGKIDGNEYLCLISIAAYIASNIGIIGIFKVDTSEFYIFGQFLEIILKKHDQIRT